MDPRGPGYFPKPDLFCSIGAPSQREHDEIDASDDQYNASEQPLAPIRPMMVVLTRVTGAGSSPSMIWTGTTSSSGPTSKFSWSVKAPIIDSTGSPKASKDSGWMLTVKSGSTLAESRSVRST